MKIEREATTNWNRFCNSRQRMNEINKNATALRDNERVRASRGCCFVCACECVMCACFMGRRLRWKHVYARMLWVNVFNARLNGLFAVTLFYGYFTIFLLLFLSFRCALWLEVYFFSFDKSHFLLDEKHRMVCHETGVCHIL